MEHLQAEGPLPLATWRYRRSYSLSELATAAGVDRQTIHRLERGLQAPHPRTRRKLAAALGVAVERIEWQPLGPKGADDDGR